VRERSRSLLGRRGDLLDGEELKAELLDTVDESVQLCAVSDWSLQNGGSFVSVHSHAVEEVGETLIEFAAHDDSVVHVVHRDVRIGGTDADAREGERARLGARFT